jgi:hypothetical protein
MVHATDILSTVCVSRAGYQWLIASPGHDVTSLGLDTYAVVSLEMRAVFLDLPVRCA